MAQEVERFKGTCKRWLADKGFGFIELLDGSGEVFVHKSEIKANGAPSLEKGEHLELDVVIQDDGKKKAIHVTGPNNSFVKGQTFFDNSVKGWADNAFNTIADTIRSGQTPYKSFIRFDHFFIPIKELPGEYDYNEEFYNGHFPSHHWCLIGEIQQNISFLRPGCIVKDINNDTIPIHFYLNGATHFDSSKLKKHSILCLRYALKHDFMDMSVGIRVEEEHLSLMHIINNLSLDKLLQMSDTGGFTDFYHKNILNIEQPQKVYNNKCWYDKCESDEHKHRKLPHCAGCKMAKYCCKEHQTKHWKSGHKNECKNLLPQIKKLFSIRLDEY
eukprot:207038_1